MININYYNKQGNQVATEVATGELGAELLILTYQKCVLLGYYTYVAEDTDGNYIEETVLKDENEIDDFAEEVISKDEPNDCVEQPRKAGHKCRPVAQYTKDGNLVAVWSSVIEAGRHTGASNICDAAHGKLKTSGGYVWKYVEDDKEC